MKNIFLCIVFSIFSASAHAELLDEVEKLNETINKLRKPKKERHSKAEAPSAAQDDKNISETPKTPSANETSVRQTNTITEPEEKERGDTPQSNLQPGKLPPESDNRYPVAIESYKYFAKNLSTSKRTCEKNLSNHYFKLAKKFREGASQANTKDNEKSMILQAEIWENANDAFARVGCFVKFYYEVEGNIYGTFGLAPTQEMWKLISSDQLTQSLLKKVDASLIKDHEKWLEQMKLSNAIRNSLFSGFHLIIEDYFLYNAKNENVIGCEIIDIGNERKKIKCDPER